jgi:hypothetical protein
MHTSLRSAASSSSRSRDRRGWRRTALLGSLALVSGAAMATGAGGPASASSSALLPLTGVVKVQAESPYNSAPAKSVPVECPNGKKVINASGFIAGGVGSVAMDDIYPNDALTQVMVTGKETDPYTSDWSVTVSATCADEPLGLERIYEESVTDTDPSKTLGAACSANKTLLGTGASIVGGQGEVVIDEIVPNGGLGNPADEVKVIAHAADPFNVDWRLNTFAICADPVAGQEVVKAESGLGLANQGARADCDPTSQIATGSGVEIIGVGGEVVIHEAWPSDGSTALPPTTTRVYGAVEDPTPNQWGINAYALCADA